MTKERLIKVYDIAHALDIIFFDNLMTEFENEIVEVEDGETYGAAIERKGVTLNQLVDFLNKHKEHNETYILA